MSIIKIPYIESAENKFYSKKLKLPKHPLGSFGPRRSSDREMNTSLGFVREYGTSIEGITRILLILSLTAGWISGACISRAYVYDRSNEGFKKYVYDNFEQFLQTRTAYVIVTVLAMIMSFVDFCVKIGNIDNMKFSRKLKLKWLYVSLDVIFMLLIFSLSIACTVREVQLRTNYSWSLVTSLFNLGAFAACAAFGYLATILYLIILTVYMFDICSPIVENSTQNTRASGQTETNSQGINKQARSSRSPKVEFTVNSGRSSPTTSVTPNRHNTHNQSFSNDNFERAMGYLATLFYICLITLWCMNEFIPHFSETEVRTTRVEASSGINKVPKRPNSIELTTRVHQLSEI